MNKGLLTVARKLSGYKVLDVTESKFNGRLEVIREFGETRVMTGGITQSGKPLEMVWGKSLASIKIQETDIKKILILGLGAGTLARMVNHKFPQAKIVGVEIDREMVRVGEKYFGLGNINNLEIIYEDAYKFCADNKKSRDKYDVIFIDLYRGQKVPENLDSKVFFRLVINLLVPKGRVFINRLYFDEISKITAEGTINELKSMPGLELTLMHSFTNLIVEVSQSGVGSDKTV